MIKLYIDNHSIEIDQETEIAINLSIAAINSPGESSVAFTKTIKVPITDINRVALGFTEQIYSKDQFNNVVHKAYIESDGFIVMSGTVEMKSININGEGCYNFNIIGDEVDWIKRAQGKLTDLQSEEGVKYTEEDVAENASLPSNQYPLVRFIPVDKGAFYNEDTNGDLIPRTNLVFRDYHPFLNLWKVLELIFGSYKLECPLSDRLKRIYFPGAITEPEDMSYIIAENDFCAGVRNGKTITAFTERYPYNRPTIIDSVTPRENTDLFDNGVTKIKHRAPSPYHALLVYTPKSACTVSFDVKLQYAFNAMMAYGNYMWENPSIYDTYYFDPIFPDRLRVEIEDRYFMDIPIEGGDIAGAQLFPTEPIMQTDTTATLLYLKFKAPENINYIETISSAALGLVQVCKVYPNQSTYLFSTPGGHGSIYVGFFLHNGEYISLNVDNASQYGYFMYLLIPKDDNLVGIIKKKRTDAYALQANQAVNILTYLLTPNSECEVKIGDETTIKPNFESNLAYGSNVSINNIGGDTSQIEIIKAVRQMFNLMFYTNTLKKEVIIKPSHEFYEPIIVNWVDKIDYNKDIIIEELGTDIGTYLELKYQEGSEVVKAYNRKNKTELGAQKFTLENKTSIKGTQIFNALFQPSRTRKVGEMVYTPQLVLDSEKQTIDDVGFNIDPIIVEVVDNNAAAVVYKYPIAAFQQFGANLGYNTISENGNNINGLSKYYEDNISQYNNGRKITAYLRLSPLDVEQIVYYNRYKRDFRATFKLQINCEDVLCYLEGINDYSPSQPSTKCQFITIPIQDTPQLDLSLRLEPDAIQAAAQSGTQTIKVYATGEWMAINNEAWLSINPNTGVGDGDVVVGYSANGLTNRDAVVAFKLKTDEAISDNLSISQENAAADSITIDTPTYPAPNTAGNKQVNITANGDWTVTSNQSWVTVNPGSGTGDGTTILTFTANPDAVQRTATIIYTRGTAVKTTIVTQAAAADSITIDTPTFSAPNTAGERSVKIVANGDWTVTSNQSWATIVPASGTGNANVKIKYSANADTSARTAIITYTRGTATAATTITQAAAADSIYVDTPTYSAPNASGAKAVTIIANGSWTATSNAIWATLSNKSGTGNSTITISFAANAGAQRTATITYTRGTAVVTTVVTQTAADSIVAIPTSRSVGNAKGTTAINIEANGSWSASHSSLLTLTPNSGTGNTGVVISYPANAVPQVAEYTITFTRGQKTAAFTLQQAAADEVLSWASSALAIPKNSQTTNILLTSNTYFSVASSADWVSVSPTGELFGTTSVQLSWTVNTSPERIATITATTSSGKTAVLTLTQESGEIIVEDYLTVSRDTINTGSVASNEEVSVSASGVWIASGDAAWITVDPSTFDGDKTTIVSIAANETLSRRSANVLYKLGKLSEYVKVSQEQGVYDIKTSVYYTIINTTGIEVNIEGYNISLTGTHGASTDALSLYGANMAIFDGDMNAYDATRSTILKYGGGATKLGLRGNMHSITPSYRAHKLGVFVVMVIDGSEVAEVSLPFTVSGDNVEFKIPELEYLTPLTKTSEITLRVEMMIIGNDAISVEPSAYSVPETAGSKQVNIKTLGVWTARSDKAWATVSPTRGMDNSVATISYTANTGAQRSTIVEFSRNGTNTARTTVTQAAHVVIPDSIEVSPNRAGFGFRASSRIISIRANGNWTVGALPSYLSLDSISGTSNETVLLSCQENTSATERSCVITFTCGAASAEYTFWQEAYVCSGAYINPETCTGCGLCVPECPIEGCITRIDDSYYRIDSNVCISCGTCLEAGCPTDAIEIL